jgi:hypothetical protein
MTQLPTKRRPQWPSIDPMAIAVPLVVTLSLMIFCYGIWAAS